MGTPLSRASAMPAQGRAHRNSAHRGRPVVGAARPRGDADMSDAEEAVRAYVEGVLRPMVQVDGGDVVFEGVRAPGRIALTFRGDCSRCSAAGCRLVPWIADRIESELGTRYEIDAVMDKPYFYR